jgi:CRP-like cAMP-binding protein
MRIDELLMEAELFSEASANARKRIAANGKIISVQKDLFIFNEGDEGKTFYIVSAGSIKLVKNSFDGKEVLVRLVNQFETFGEVILFEKKEYPVTAIAVENSELFAIRKEEFLHLLDDSEFRNEFCSMLMRRMRYLAERVLYISAFDVEERFFRFLIERFGRSYEYTITIPKKDIAAAIGTIPETMSRLILKLKQRGIIDWEGDKLKIQNGYWDKIKYTRVP